MFFKNSHIDVFLQLWQFRQFSIVHLTAADITVILLASAIRPKPRLAAVPLKLSAPLSPAKYLSVQLKGLRETIIKFYLRRFVDFARAAISDSKLSSNWLSTVSPIDEMLK